MAAISLLVAAAFLAYDYFRVKGAFPPQTFIGSVDVSGLTQAQAFDKLANISLADAYSPIVTFEAAKSSFSFSPEALGIKLDLGQSVQRAFDLTHQESYLRELKSRLTQGAIRCPLTITVDEDQLRRVVAAMASEVSTTPRDATVVLFEETGGYHIEPEVLGREVDLAKTIEDCLARLKTTETIFPIALNITSPKITESHLRAAPPVHRLSAFTTYYGRHDSPNRIHNIKLIASWIDGTLLLPDEKFSLADKIGDFTSERGFKEAFVIYGGVLVPQLGGGTCQIGTTLFNAVKLADLDVLQRQNHSFYFNIYPLGRDATVYPGQKDLIFKNNTGHPLLIKAVATNLRLSFRLYGTPTGKLVKFSPAYILMRTATGFQPASLRQVIASDAPFRTTVIRTVFDSTGKKIKEETINSSYKLYGEKTNVPIARPEPR